MKGLLEDIATIEKAMAQIAALGEEEQPNWNQLIRWVTTKEQHAQAIQDEVSDYWLAQRIKVPTAKPGTAEHQEAYRVYVGQLLFSHQLITTAMKCKQSTDASELVGMRFALESLQDLYFSEEDLEHLRGHAGTKKDIAGIQEKIAANLEAARLKVVRIDLLTLSDEISNYRLNNGEMPESLDVLAQKDEKGLSYLRSADTLTDPWGNAYVMVEDEEDDFDILSYGSDGKPGGTGTAADISLIEIRSKASKRIR